MRGKATFKVHYLVNKVTAWTKGGKKKKYKKPRLFAFLSPSFFFFFLWKKESIKTLDNVRYTACEKL